MQIGIIGLGAVGVSVAISTLHGGIATSLLLHDLDLRRAEGEAMDLAHGAAFYPTARVRVAGLDELRDCDVLVIAAGKKGEPGQSRLALLQDNARMARSLGAELRGFAGIVVVVTNPVDVLVRVVVEASGLPPARVIGTGTLLDTTRLRQAIGRELDIDARSVHAHVVGEHGDSQVVAWSSAHVGALPLRQLEGWSRERETALATEARTAAYEIIARKGATNHAIGLVTAALLRWILRDERRVLTVSAVQADGIAYSLPSVVGRGGIVRVLAPPLDDAERAALARSTQILRDAHASIGGPT